MSQSLPVIPPPTTVTLSEQAGFRLKQIRERLGLTLRQVEEASLEIADTRAEFGVRGFDCAPQPD